MQKICKYCGKRYDGSAHSSACAECVVAVRKNVIRPRICQTCGITFDGGPRAWYCPNCRAERTKKTNKDYVLRKKTGNTRKIGSISLCEICNGEYIVTGGLQKYCKNCADIAAKEKDRESALLWYKKHNDPKKRREIRNNATAEIKCIVCGKLFKPTTKSLACSDECRIEYSMQKRKQKK